MKCVQRNGTCWSENARGGVPVFVARLLALVGQSVGDSFGWSLLGMRVKGRGGGGVQQ